MLKILAVEDNPGDQVLLKEALTETDIDYSVKFSLSATDSIQDIYVEKPDLIIMDINMPGIRGDEFIGIDQTGPNITGFKKVIFLTGADLPESQYDPQTQKILIEDRSYTLIKKPVNHNDLKRIILSMMVE